MSEGCFTGIDVSWQYFLPQLSSFLMCMAD
jgi:hypothetical protein